MFVVNTYNKELKKAFDFGLNHFWYDQNSLKGELPMNIMIFLLSKAQRKMRVTYFMVE